MPLFKDVQSRERLDGCSNLDGKYSFECVSFVWRQPFRLSAIIAKILEGSSLRCTVLMTLNQRLFKSITLFEGFRALTAGMLRWYPYVLYLIFLHDWFVIQLVDGLGPPDDVGVCDLDCCNAWHSRA